MLASLLVGLASVAPAERATGAEAYATPAVASAASDTLRFTTPAGQPFLTALPARVRGAEATYRVVEAPALSWLVDRSFFWNVVTGERGTLPIRFERTVGGRAEPFVLLVQITP